MEKKFFYDHYTDADICGMYTVGHFVTIFLFFGLLVLALFLSRRATEKQVKRIHLGVAIFVTVLEIVKISLRVYKGQGADSWVPLYYCSLFIFAIWLSLCKKDWLNRIGYSYITMGGATASVFFTFYPSTSLALYPLLHPSSIHSFLYHWIMCYTGLLLLMKGRYAPTAKDAVYYFIFIFIACIPSYILNETIGTNCMFLRHAFKLPILEGVLNTSKWLYMAIVFLAQAVGMYWLNYGIYKLYYHIKAKKEYKQ